MEGALINHCKQSRKINPSARRGQLDRIRKADSGHTGDVFSASRCFVTKRNSTPGYRGSREAGRMDCHQKVQNGHRVLYGDRCAGSGNSLMSLMVLVFLAMVLILPVCSGFDPCKDIEEVADEWRDLSSSGGKTDHCDENRFVPDKWYSFHLRGKPAWIPVQCVKSNMCGASVGMRVDLIGQPLPSVGENITAALCGAYDVLGKYDCCVLRTTVYIARCPDDRLVYSFPTPVDRCPVAVCTQGEIKVPPAALAKMGDDVSKSDDSSVTDIPDTTPGDADSATAASTTVEEIVSDSTPESEESTESPAPPQSFMQQTTDSETTTSDIDEEVTTDGLAPETTPSLSSTETSSNVDVESQGTDASTMDLHQVSDSVTESGNDSETSSTLVYELHTLTNPSSVLPDEITEVTTTPTTPDQTSAEADSTDTALPPDANQETTSDNTSDISSDVNLISATDISTTEQPLASVTETQTTTESVTDEELSSTIQSLGDEDSKRSNYSDDEATTSAELGLSNTASTVPSSSEMYDPLSKSAAEEEETTSSTPTSTVIITTTAETTGSTPTTESMLDTMKTTRKSTKWTQPLPASRTTPEGIDVTTRKITDVIMDENLRFVFQGTPQSVYLVAEVQDLLDKFLKKAKGNSDWSYELSNGTEAVNYQNTSTYMDFRIVRRGNDVKEGKDFFKEHQLTAFISENSNMILIAVCRASKECQEEPYFITPLASVFEENAPAFTAVIVLCAICLLILVLVALYWRFSKRGSWKAPDPEPNTVPENRRHYNGNQSPFTDDQIMKDEMVDNASASYSGSAKDGDTNLSGTWVIPLDQDNQQTSVSITTQDTKF